MFLVGDSFAVELWNKEILSGWEVSLSNFSRLESQRIMCFRHVEEECVDVLKVWVCIWIDGLVSMHKLISANTYTLPW
jgi:hypothetical protein